MSLGKLCTRHNIPTSVCSLCKGANEERERIIASLETAEVAFDYYAAYLRRDTVIAIIKGENE